MLELAPSLKGKRSMKFDKPSAVANIVYYLREADLPRATNRALINSLFNGDTPWTETEADSNGVNTNVNFLDPARIAHGARNTLNNAVLKPGNFFKISVPDAPAHKASTWGRELTKLINRPMKKSKAYRETLRATFAQTVLHGAGPALFDSSDKWCPDPIGIEELLIPARVRASFDNLEYFAVYREYTPSKLFKKTHGKYVDKGWNKKMVNTILKKYKDDFGTPSNGDITQFPEKVEEAIGKDLAFFENEAVPQIKMWEFYFKDDESVEEKWYKRIILDSEEESEMAGDFLYKSDRVVGNSVDEILHVLFADGANVAPFKYHSVRGIGWLLYAVCHLQNRLMCKVTDSAFEQLMWYFRVSNPEDRERLKMIDLHTMGILPEGLDFVKAQDRYTPNPTFISQALAMNNQKMAESSSQFKAEIDNGTSKEMTAQEVMARMQSANALVGSTLNFTASQMEFQFREICRRFCNKKSSDKDVKEFQKQAKKAGIPEEYIDSDKWEIEPEMVLGAGNKTLEIAQAKELLGIRPLLDPEAQREVDHMFVEAVTDNPKLAERFVPTQKHISPTIQQAQLAAGALLLGLPVSVAQGLNRIDYIEAQLVSLGSVIERIVKTGNMTDIKEVYGLKNLATHISQNIGILAQDRAETQRVKKYGDALGEFVNLIKGFEQRLMEQQPQQGNGEAQARIQEKLILAETNARIKEASSQQKLKQKDEAFIADQARKNASLQNELMRDSQKTAVDVEAKDIETAAEIRRQNELSRTQKTTE